MLTDPAVRRLQRLTEKERACLRLVAKRLSSKEIAAELGIAKTSVDTYCNRARAKLEVADRFEAARLAVAYDQMRAPAEAPTPAEVDPAADPPHELIGRARIGWLTVAIGALIGVLALASLVSGMSALDDMKDHPHPPKDGAPTGFPGPHDAR